MPTKQQIITKRINSFLDFAESQNLPFTSKLREMTKNYDLTYIAGLVERFIIPVKDRLPEYLEQEYATIKLLYPIESDGFELTDIIKERIVTDLTYIIRIIEM